jgi:peptide/nickel transport system substrate-binding protein
MGPSRQVIEVPMARRRYAFAAGLVLAALLAACAGDEDQLRLGDRSEVIIATATGPVDLDPHGNSEEITNTLCFHLFDPLVFLDRNFKVIPWVAASWRNPDPVTWIISIRPDIVFHDGSRLTARDVVYSFERILSLPRSPRKPFLVNIQSFQVLDDTTIRVMTRQPYMPLMSKLAQILVVPERYYQGKSAEFLRFNPMGSGPYRLARYERNREITLQATRRHWRHRRLFETVRFRIIGDNTLRTRQLLAGKVDFVKDPEPSLMPEVRAAAEFRTEVVTGIRLVFIGLTFNPTLAGGAPNPFAAPEVRRAVSMAVNRDMLCRQTMSDMAKPARQPVSPLVFGYADKVSIPPYDPPGAVEILRRHRFPFGREFPLYYPAQKYFRIRETVEECSRHLAVVGIRTKPMPMQFDSFLTNLTNRRYDCFVSGWLAISGDSSDFCENCFHSGRGNPNFGFFNPVSYNNPDMDLLIERSTQTADREQRLAVLQQIMGKCVDEMVWIPLYFLRDGYAFRREIVWHPRYDRYVLAMHMEVAGE